MFQMELKSKN